MDNFEKMNNWTEEVRGQRSYKSIQLVTVTNVICFVFTFLCGCKAKLAYIAFL